MRETLEALVGYARTGSGRVAAEGPAVAAMRIGSALRLSPLAAYHWPMYGESIYFDIGPARTALGCAPRYGSDDMLIESYDWYLGHRGQVLAERSRSPHRSALDEGILRQVGRLI
jgi:nucleoside-diphosphate-sugar epimerase